MDTTEGGKKSKTGEIKRICSSEERRKKEKDDLDN
jgi:hypothetical protein